MTASVSALRAMAALAIALALSDAAAKEIPLPDTVPRVEKSWCRHARTKDVMDWSKYKTIHLHPVVIPTEVRTTGARHRIRESYVLSDKEVEALQDSFAKTFRNILGDAGFRFVDAPEADTLIVNPIVLDITLGAPGERVSYGGKGRDAARGGGALTMAAVLADGATGEVLAEVAGHRYPSDVWRGSNAVTNLSDARMTFGIWSRALRDKIAPPK